MKIRADQLNRSENGSSLDLNHAISLGGVLGKTVFVPFRPCWWLVVAVGAFDRQVAIGNIPPENLSLNANFMTLYLAERLGMDLPELGPDFYAFMSKLTPVDEKKES